MLLQLEGAALKALEQRGMAREEAGLLRGALEAMREEGEAGGEERDRRVREGAQQRVREEAERAKVMTGLHKVAAHLAGGKGGGGGGSSGGSALPPPQYMSEAVAAVAGVVGQRERLRAEVFRPGYSLPSMSVEQWGDQEVAAMRAQERERAEAEAEARHEEAISVGGGRRGGDGDDEGYDDAATAKQRAWDDWKDDNPRGQGNSAIRPCGR